MTRTAQRSKLFPYTTLFRSRNGIGHQSIQADGREQQRESRKETGEHGGDALFDKCAADDLGDRFGAERVFVSERLDPVAHGFCERFGRSVGAHYEIAPLPRILETGKKNEGRGGIAENENSGIPDNANNFNILKFGPEPEANGFSYGIAIRKESFC